MFELSLLRGNDVFLFKAAVQHLQYLLTCGLGFRAVKLLGPMLLHAAASICGGSCSAVPSVEGA